MNVMKYPIAGLLSLLMVLAGGVGAEQSDTETSASDPGPIEQMRADMTTGFSEYELTGDPNYDFANLIVELNSGAREMARWIVENGDYERLSFLAEDSISVKQEQQDQLRQWLERNPEPRPIDEGENFIESMEAVRERLEQSRRELFTDGESGQAFAEAMVWHHEAAYAVAQTFLQFSVDAQLRLVATEVARSNSRQIASYTNWLSRQ